MTGYESKRAAAQDKLESMEREALKLALEALKRIKTYGDVFLSRSHEQKPYDQVCEAIEVAEKALAQPAQERNFCPRCGKRTWDIHTCTAPLENT